MIIFKCMQHTGLRPVTHHTTPSHKIGWLYTYPTDWNKQDHFSICQQCPPNIVDRKQFQPADHVPVQHTSPIGGNQTHDLRLTILDPDHLANGTHTMMDSMPSHHTSKLTVKLVCSTITLKAYSKIFGKVKIISLLQVTWCQGFSRSINPLKPTKRWILLVCF